MVPPASPKCGPEMTAPDRAGTVYLLHFDRPYAHAKHYLGWTTDLPARLAEHAAGRGARLLAVVHAAGIGWRLARTWPGSRARERQLKRQGGASRCCPACGVRPRTPTPRPVTHSPDPEPPTTRRTTMPCYYCAADERDDRWTCTELACDCECHRTSPYPDLDDVDEPAPIPGFAEPLGLDGGAGEDARPSRVNLGGPEAVSR